MIFFPTNVKIFCDRPAPAVITWHNSKKIRCVSEGEVEVYLILWQTFFPEGSSVCEEDSEQQSRAPRALRRSFISTQTPKSKPRNEYLSVSRLCVQSFFPTMRGSISLSVYPPPFPPSLPPVSRLVAPAQPERSKPRGFLFPFPGEVRATSFYSARHRAF